jgi:hypothetical protein
MLFSCSPCRTWLGDELLGWSFCTHPSIVRSRRVMVGKANEHQRGGEAMDFTRTHRARD